MDLGHEGPLHCLLGRASSLSASEQLSLKSQEFKPSGVASQASARCCPLGSFYLVILGPSV